MHQRFTICDWKAAWSPDTVPQKCPSSCNISYYKANDGEYWYLVNIKFKWNQNLLLSWFWIYLFFLGSTKNRVSRDKAIYIPNPQSNTYCLFIVGWSSSFPQCSIAIGCFYSSDSSYHVQILAAIRGDFFFHGTLTQIKKLEIFGRKPNLVKNTILSRYRKNIWRNLKNISWIFGEKKCNGV